MKTLRKMDEVAALAYKWKTEPNSWHEYTYDDGAFNRLVVTDYAESWDDFLAWMTLCSGWGFRGQRRTSWTLQTTLERDAANGGIRTNYSYGNSSGYRYPDRREVENRLLPKFKELARNRVQGLPLDDDALGWFALMQHYGGPTRLLDWTYCPFVGIYFALREPSCNQEHFALWAIDLDWLELKARCTLGTKWIGLNEMDPQAKNNLFNNLLDEEAQPLVVRIDPFRRNDRLEAQKGFFLWKLFEKTPLFDQMLMDMMLNPEIVQSPVIRKLEVSAELRADFLERLRERYVYEDRLFPGHNFCDSLKIELQSTVERARAEYEAELRAVQIGEVETG